MHRCSSWEENTRGFGSKAFWRNRRRKKQKRTSNVQSRKAGPNVQLKKRRSMCRSEVASAVRRLLSVRRGAGRTAGGRDHDRLADFPFPDVFDVIELL